MTRSFFALIGSIAIVLGSAPSSAQMAYITSGSGVSVIDTATNTVVGAPIPVAGFGVAVSPNGSRVYVAQGSLTGVAVSPDGSKVYIANVCDGGSVSVIDTATNTVVGTITIPHFCVGNDVGSVSVIDTATNTVVATIPVTIDFFGMTLPSIPEGVAVTPDGTVYVTTFISPPDIGVPFGFLDVIGRGDPVALGFGTFFGVAISPDGSKVYVANSLFSFGSVSVIDTATNTVTARIPVGSSARGIPARGIAITPDGSKVYVPTDVFGTTGFPVPGSVSVIDTATNTVVSTIPIGSDPQGIAITPDGSKVYVANKADNTVSVIDTATNTVVAVLPVGNEPIAFGVFIQPRFAGTRGDKNCFGVSVSALAQTFGDLNAAAIALGFPTVQALRGAVNAFCAA